MQPTRLQRNKACFNNNSSRGEIEVPHNVITLLKTVVDLRTVLHKLHADLCSAIRSFQIT